MMTSREDYTEISVEEGLLPQIIRELLSMTTNPNYVEVSYGTAGRVILAHPELAEAWYQKVSSTIPSASPDGEES